MRLRAVIVFLSALASATAGSGAACVYDWTFTPRAIGADASADAADADAGRRTEDATPPPPPPPVPPPLLACKSSQDCVQPGSYCDFPDDLCGLGQPGTCVSMPGCTGPVAAPSWCGCDKIVYGSDCQAYAKGTDLAAKPSCALNQGQFYCGYRICEAATEYCQQTLPGTAGKPTEFTCVSFASTGCLSKDCACFSGKCSKCQGSAAAGGVTLTCP